MTKLEAYVKGEIFYILNERPNLTEEVLRIIFDTHKTMVRLDYMIEENEKLIAAWEANTAHGHGGNDNIPQPDFNAGMMSPMTRVESNGTGGENGC